MDGEECEIDLDDIISQFSSTGGEILEISSPGEWDWLIPSNSDQAQGSSTTTTIEEVINGGEIPTDLRSSELPSSEAFLCSDMSSEVS